jgi:hypothetical protein
MACDLHDDFSQLFGNEAVTIGAAPSPLRSDCSTLSREAPSDAGF